MFRPIGTCLLLTVLLLTVSLSEAQQQQKTARLGILRSGVFNTTGARDTTEAFRQRLRELGWVEGQNIVVEHRYAEGRFERLPGFALELIRLPADVIYAAISILPSPPNKPPKPYQLSS